MTLRNLHSQRLSGFHPTQVCLSLCGHLNLPVEVIQIRPGDDFRAIAGLKVVVACMSAQLNTLMSMIDDMVRVPTESLEVWCIDTGNWVAVTERNDVHIFLSSPWPKMTESVIGALDEVMDNE